MKHRKSLALASALVCAGLSTAVGAQSIDECKKQYCNEYKEVGQTRLSVLFWDVYDAFLYTTDGDFDWSQRKQQRKALLLRYLRDIEAKGVGGNHVRRVATASIVRNSRSG